MCEDSAVRAHRVVLSACSPYFQKIFIDNPGKHPIVVLKDVLCWEMQCILDFMYKGETSVPEPQLTSLIKAAESLKVRGLTAGDHQPGGGSGRLPPGVSLSSSSSSSTPTNLSSGHHHHHHHDGGRRSAEGGYRGYSPSPSPSSHHHHRYIEPSGKMMAHNLTGSSGSGGDHQPTSPLSLLTPHHHHHHNGGGDHLSDRASGGRASPLLLGGSGGSGGSGGNNCPRRKQARPRRRSGDSVNSSLDLSKAGSPPLSYSTGGTAAAKRESPPSSLGGEDHPENLSLRRSHSPPPPPSHHYQQQQQQQHATPAINLVKMEQLVETERRMDQDNIRQG
jgi:BTB/POZ domain